MKKTNLFSNIFAVVIICTICILGFSATEVSAISKEYNFHLDTNVEYNMLALVNYDPFEYDPDDDFYEVLQTGYAYLSFNVPQNGFINIDDGCLSYCKIKNVNSKEYQKFEFNTDIPVVAGNYVIETYVDGEFVLYYIDDNDWDISYNSGIFTINYEPADIAAEEENNESFDNATEINANETIYAFIVYNDVDTYHFNLENNSKVVISSDLSAKFELYSEDKNGNISKVTADINKNVRLSAGSYVSAKC